MTFNLYLLSRQKDKGMHKGGKKTVLESLLFGDLSFESGSDNKLKHLCPQRIVGCFRVSGFVSKS